METREIRDGIEDLNRDYVHCIDDGRLDEWPDFFTADCRYRIIHRDSFERGEVAGIYYCDSRDMLRDRVLTLNETSIYEAHHYRHTISATRVTASNGEAHIAETSFVVIRTMRSGEPTIFCTGKYVDTVVFGNGGARFSEKLVLTDSARYDMMLAMPI